METPPVTVEQRHTDYAEEATSAANIVSHDGYYEADVDAVASVFARFESDHLTRIERENAALLREQALKIAEFVRNWNGETRDGDTLLISRGIEDRFARNFA